MIYIKKECKDEYLNFSKYTHVKKYNKMLQLKIYYILYLCGNTVLTTFKKNRSYYS